MKILCRCLESLSTSSSSYHACEEDNRLTLLLRLKTSSQWIACHYIMYSSSPWPTTHRGVGGGNQHLGVGGFEPWNIMPQPTGVVGGQEGKGAGGSPSTLEHI